MTLVRRVFPESAGQYYRPVARFAAGGPLFAVAAAVLLGLLSGCGALISNASGRMADDLSTAILNQDDPELVREGLPSYLLLLDSLARANPDSPATLSAAAQLYAAYGIALVNDPDRAKLLTARARRYGEQALCAARASACNLKGIQFDRYVEIISAVDADDIDALYSYSLSSLAWIRANSGSMTALADLPKVEFALEHLIELEPGEYEADICMYLGILNTLRPPALGGEPDVARDWFERGIALSNGKNLSIKVEFARNYARMLYDRELHDRLLNEVMAADVQQPDQTLFNIIARQEAEDLLATADDYF